MIKNNYQIRSMQAADLSAVLLIEQQQAFPWTETMLRDCLTAHYDCWVLIQEHKIIGYAIIVIASQQADILNIAIDAAYRRQGFGKILLQYVIADVKSKNVKQLFLEVRVSNSAAIQLYKKCHFTEIGKRKHYYTTKNNLKEDAIVMELVID